ncbi:MAG: alpha/beta fold hydrolase [Gammaproteobacteria bacterium]|nr:alpha/beta fold hydrolase [Gammaproteobacteria bacterium]
MNKSFASWVATLAAALLPWVPVAALAAAATPTAALAPGEALHPQEGDFVLHDFHFGSGETLAALRLHYTTLGAPQRDARGRISNAVLILHGTGGDGHQFLRPQFAGVLFRAGGLLDPARYYIILPDGIGHGRSSKPSDGAHARFPHYAYADMVEAQYQLVTRGLGVERLRLVMGTSMGCMHAFMWGELHADRVDALMPLACLPVQIAGRNRMWRRLIIDAITADPGWQHGDYRHEPTAALRGAAAILLIAGSAPALQQRQYPTRDEADARTDAALASILDGLDANDLLYQVSASRDYDPRSRLGEIRAPLMWVNSADDFINPPELGIAEREVARIPHGQFVLLPVGENTHGHGTHTWAVAWQDYLRELLARSAPGG